MSNDFASEGSAAAADADPWRAAALVVCGAICSVLFALFAAIDFLADQRLLALFALAGLPVGLVTVLIGRHSRPLPVWAPYPLAVFLVALLAALPHLTPKPHGAALMWYCAAPPFLVFGLGTRVGLGFCLALFGAFLAAVLGTDDLLPADFALRYGVAYGLITVTMYLYESRREAARRALVARQDEIRRLRGLLNVCGWCHKRIRDEKGDWVAMERYLQDRAPVQVSHGICPSCEAGMLDQLDCAN